jgi:hypothetical protein
MKDADIAWIMSITALVVSVIALAIALLKLFHILGG